MINATLSIASPITLMLQVTLTLLAFKGTPNSFRIATSIGERIGPASADVVTASNSTHATHVIGVGGRVFALLFVHEKGMRRFIPPSQNSKRRKSDSFNNL